MDKKILLYILLGVVAFLSDFTYEGARSISGYYLGYLGAPLIIAAAASIGELVSYIARFISGFMTYRIRKVSTYWLFLYIGYALNLLSVPLMGIVDEWTFLYMLIIIERFGKGLRGPVKDVLVGETGSELGYGYAYSIHEFLDQVGGVLGPLYISISVSIIGIRNTFITLIIPAISALAVLGSMYIIESRPITIAGPLESGRAGIRNLASFLSASMLTSMIAIHWIHGSYRFQDLSPSFIGLIYMVIMFIDGLGALILGSLYRYSRYVLLLTPISFAASSIAITWLDDLYLYAVFYGVALGGLESIFKAYIAENISVEYRGLLFSLFYIVVGAGLTIGNIMYAVASGPSTVLYTFLVMAVANITIIRSIHRK